MTSKAKNPLVFVIFGATGDLATRKIIPALIEIWKRERDNLLVIAFSRRPWTDDDYRAFIKPILEEKHISPQVLKKFLERVVYVSGTFDDSSAYGRLRDKIADHEKTLTSRINILCHFAIEPEFYNVVARGLANVQLGRKAKIMLEKPFGADYRSARKIRDELEKYFPEKNIYHVDHYVTKKGLRKLIETRERNKKFESRLNAKNLDSVSLYLLEAIGIEGRARFYDAVGAIRDVGQNHMMEMLAAAAMALPVSKRNRRTVLEAMKLVPGSFRQGQCEEYRQEEGMDARSKTETAFSFDVLIDLPRWRGVVFTFQSGKYLYEQKGIEFHFKDDSAKLFSMEKTETGHADAYKTLIEKAFLGDQSYFVGIDDIMAEWKIIDEVRSKKKNVPLTLYKKGDFKI